MSFEIRKLLFLLYFFWKTDLVLDCNTSFNYLTETDFNEHME